MGAALRIPRSDDQEGHLVRRKRKPRNIFPRVGQEAHANPWPEYIRRLWWESVLPGERRQESRRRRRPGHSRRMEFNMLVSWMWHPRPEDVEPETPRRFPERLRLEHHG